MLCTVKIKLLTNKEQHDLLLDTMKHFNQACNYISQIAFNNKVYGKIRLQKMCYYDVREKFNLSSQMTVRAIGKVSESYKQNKKTLHNFKEASAMVYDERILSFKDLEIASILTLYGRIEVPMLIVAYHKGVIDNNRIRGQADLILQNGTFFLLLSIDIPESPKFTPRNIIGVDFGIKNLAVDSTGEVFSGNKLNAIRSRHRNLRQKLSKKRTKSAIKLLKKRSKKESRFVSDTNHCISKKIVEKAKDTQSAIALENLKGIKGHAEKTVKKAQRVQHSSWGFYQLRKYIEYKSIINGVPIYIVDPKYTSTTCPICGYVDKKNRQNRDTFHCLQCDFVAPSDNVAAVNIALKAM